MTDAMALNQILERLKVLERKMDSIMTTCAHLEARGEAVAKSLEAGWTAIGLNRDRLAAVEAAQVTNSLVSKCVFTGIGAALSFLAMSILKTIGWA